jgi:hypothetical protein
MSTCSKCCQHGDSQQEEQQPKSTFRIFGFYSQCDNCNRLYFRQWNGRSIAVIVLTVVLLQFLVSLLVFPLLKLTIASEVVRIAVFTTFHLACLPLYTLTSISLMLNSGEDAS